MSGIPRPKACNACAASKRRCGKQSPCIRCRKHGIACVYPPSKPTNFVPIPDTPPRPSETLPDNGKATLAGVEKIVAGCPLQLNPQPCPADNNIGLPFSMHVSDLNGYVDRSMALSKYVTATETWSNGGLSQRYELDATVMDNMKQQMSTLNRWFEEWTERGSNPFIHERLYRTRLPECVQDAYMALTCYIHKTEANKQMALRIVEDRARQLIATAAGQDDDDSDNAESCELDILARVHALLVYQFIGLYDGDIRLRHVCEGHIPILDAWCYRLVQYTAYPLGLTDGSYSSAAQAAGHFEHAGGLSLGDKCWMSWILAESIQRTWIMATAIHHFYAMAKDLQPMNCPHTAKMVFTSREGLWSASSAAKWEGVVSGVDVGFTRLAGCEKLFTEFLPSTVDEFAKMILRSRFGSDSVERWCMSDVTV